MDLADRKVQIVSAADGEPGIAAAEQAALAASGIRPAGVMSPKSSLGNLFAAAAAVQVGLAAQLAGSTATDAGFWPTASASAASRRRLCWRPHETGCDHGHRHRLARRHRP